MEKKKIHEAMCGIMRDCGAIGKDRKNLQQNFKFRGIDDTYNALHDVFAKHGVVILPEVLKHCVSERATAKGGVAYDHLVEVRFNFMAEDGSSVSAAVVGEAADSGDKGVTKAASIALKYALFQIFLIPTEGSPDADAESFEFKGNKAETPAAKPSAKDRALTPDEIAALTAKANELHPDALANTLRNWGCLVSEITLSQKKDFWRDLQAEARALNEEGKGEDEKE